MVFALPGGAYVYQGEELGLEEVLDLPDALRQDPTFRRTAGAEIGRDGCRVPIPWSGDAPPFGFGPGSGEPWLPQPAHWKDLTAEREAADPDSMLALYRAALALRRESPALGDGTLTWLDSPPGVLTFRRSADFTCVVNLSADPVPISGEILLSSGPIPGTELPPDTAAWLAT
jgi:alpha-glucosidase